MWVLCMKNYRAKREVEEELEAIQRIGRGSQRKGQGLGEKGSKRIGGSKCLKKSEFM